VDRQVDTLAGTLLAGDYQSFYLTFQLFHLTGFFEAFLRLILAKLSGIIQLSLESLFFLFYLSQFFGSSIKHILQIEAFLFEEIKFRSQL
jgi:hypothetical protein